MASVDTVAMAVMHCVRSRVAGTFNVADAVPVELAAWVDRIADTMRVRHPGTLPLPLLQAMATAGSAAAAVGLPAPLTRASLAKLITSFSLNVDKLAASGFVWPQTQDSVLEEMVAAFLASQQS
jgi:hypothetical protein